MGLDMYLSARRYTSDFSGKDANLELKPIADRLLPPDGNYGAIEIRRDVAYWRKANQIHAWFVTNVQEGIDSCGRYYVAREQLEKLRDTCLKVIADPSLASTLLPTQEGFFFGGTEYDEGYLEDLKNTVEQLDKIFAWCGLTGNEDVEFEYHSSW